MGGGKDSSQNTPIDDFSHEIAFGGVEMGVMMPINDEFHLPL